MVQKVLMEVLLKQLKIRGWKQNGGYAIRGNTRVLESQGKRIVVVNQ